MSLPGARFDSSIPSRSHNAAVNQTHTFPISTPTRSVTRFVTSSITRPLPFILPIGIVITVIAAILVLAVIALKIWRANDIHWKWIPSQNTQPGNDQTRTAGRRRIPYILSSQGVAAASQQVSQITPALPQIYIESSTPLLIPPPPLEAPTLPTALTQLAGEIGSLIV